MHVTAIKTHKITTEDKSIFAILDKYLPAGRQGLPQLDENTVIAITSKIIAITEGSVKEAGSVDKEKLAEEASEYYLPKETNKYGFTLSVKNSMFIASGGIDESNGNGLLILWPKNPWESAAKIRDYLRKKRAIKNLGVLITDSKTTPLRWGVTGVGIAYAGFSPLNNYIGKPDVFGRPLHVTKENVLDGLAASAVLVMGEGSEQTPIALINDIPFIQWQEENPTKEEIEALRISLEEDVYAAMLTAAPWKKGKAQ